jgi:uncharacterized protein YecT (DUF1311 family)
MKALLTVAMILIATPSFAADLTPEFKECLDKASTNVDFSVCTGDEMTRQEAALAGALTDTSTRMKRVSPDTVAPLLAEQDLWTKWKDSACRLYQIRDVFGREGEALQYGICKATVIAQRVEYLKNMATLLGH